MLGRGELRSVDHSKWEPFSSVASEGAPRIDATHPGSPARTVLADLSMEMQEGWFLFCQPIWRPRSVKTKRHSGFPFVMRPLVADPDV